jgi:hypothetical protein
MVQAHIQKKPSHVAYRLRCITLWRVVRLARVLLSVSGEGRREAV